MFPGLVAIGVIIVVGLCAYLPCRWVLPTALLLTIIMFGMSAASLWDYYWPAYHPTPVPDIINQPLQYRFGNPPVAELIGMSPVKLQAYPGGLIRITLYWRALQTVDHDLVVYLHSVGSQAVIYNSYPGGGTLLATDWQPGQTWSEAYSVTVPADSPPQNVYPLIAGLSDRATGEPLPAYTANGESTSPVIARVAINKPAESLPTPNYRLASSIGLTTPIITVKDQTVNICVNWLALDQPPQDYQVFVHLFDAKMQLLAQLDTMPLAGQYPMGAWTRGERIADCMQLHASQIPDGAQVTLGIYDPTSHERVDVLDATGHKLDNSEIRLPVVR
jgi:hypothetical protein